MYSRGWRGYLGLLGCGGRRASRRNYEQGLALVEMRGEEEEEESVLMKG